ncbi:MAG: M48 family metalloprotease [Candidatus Omnitrophica bacterium]|nr:M48 family metalloprotease [Candidatus Omnitrophota bacterium]
MRAKVFALPVLSTLLALAAGCAPTSSYNIATGRQETLFISPDREIALGESVAKQVEEELPIVRDPELTARLDRIGSRIAAVADRKDLSYRFTIVEMRPKDEPGEEDQPNAFALPGGPVYVSKALMELAESDDELAAVLSHEVGHIVGKHSAKRIQGAVGLQVLELLAAGTGAADARTRQGMQLAFVSLLMEYSQADELEADRLSIRYLKAAGFDPHAAITFMQRLREHTFKQPMRRYSYFRTHPYYADRIRLLRQHSEGKITFDDYINRK